MEGGVMCNRLLIQIFEIFYENHRVTTNPFLCRAELGLLVKKNEMHKKRNFRIEKF